DRAKRPADHYQPFVLRRLQPRRQGCFGPRYWSIPPLLYLAGRPNPSYRALPAAKTAAGSLLRRFYGIGTADCHRACRAQPAQPWIQNSGNAVFPKSCTDQGSNIMKLLILNASPKKRGGASQFFSGILRLFLPSLVKKTVPLRS